MLTILPQNIINNNTIIIFLYFPRHCSGSSSSSGGSSGSGSGGGSSSSSSNYVIIWKVLRTYVHMGQRKQRKDMKISQKSVDVPTEQNRKAI